MASRKRARGRVWLFDLDDTLHDASHASLPHINRAMTDYIRDMLGLDDGSAGDLRSTYWRRYGATLLGLVHHHGIRAAHFLDETHRLPGLEQRLRASAHDRVALRRLPGRKVVLTNAPAAYARRVLEALDLAGCFDTLVSIERMSMFGRLRPKPDARMLRHVAARLRVHPARCVLVEDTLTHQRAARRVGMRAVWMKRYAMGSKPGREVGVYLRGRPAYVCATINSLHTLHFL